MGKSFLERLARGLGKSTGKLVEKAKEKGLDKKAGKLVEKAQAKLKDLVKEYEDGQNEGREEREAASDKDGEPTPGGESSAEEVSEGKSSAEEVSAGEVSEGDDWEPASSAGNVSEDGETGDAVETDEDRRGDEPTGESGGARDT